MKKPQPNEYGGFYKNYIDAVSEEVELQLQQQLTLLPELLLKNESKADYAYADSKWTVKQLLGHMIDTERIMAYRLLRISRNDQTPLPGFEEDDYVLNAGHDKITLHDLLAEFELVRKSSLMLIKNLTEVQLNHIGTASNLPVSARALVFIIAGHLQHHYQILQSRYGLK